jgi:hypothetical protein
MALNDDRPDFSRRSSQGTISRGQPDCLLTVGSQRLAAVLGDEWDNGMSVMVQGTPSFWVEDTGMLQSADVEIEVRVSNIVRLDAEGEEDEPAETVPTFRIGLVRLSQIAVKLRPDPKSVDADSPPSPSLPYRDPKPSRAFKAGRLTLVRVASLLVVVAAAWQIYRWIPVGTFQNRNAADANSPSNASTLLTPSLPKPAAAILHLPGVEPFLNTDVANRLELTPSQTGAFARLNKATQEALEELAKYWESGSRSEFAGRRELLLNAALQEGLHLLSDKQRQQWDEMTH